MTDVRKARQLFELGVLSLGIPVEGTDPVDNKAQATKAFTRASEWDPTMADAWLGRLACGDTSNEVLFALYRHSDRIGAEQRRLGLPPRTLVGRWYTGMFLDYPLSDAVEAAAAYAATLIAGDDFAGARDVVDAIAEQRRTPIVTFVEAVLYFRTGRWPDVLSTLARSEQWHDPHMSAVADYLTGTACAQLGMSAEAIRRLERAMSCAIPACASRAMYTYGLTLRGEGKQAQATSMLEQAFASDPSLTAAADALRSPATRLTVTTADEIAARTDPWDPASVPTTPGPLTSPDKSDETSQTAEDLVSAAQAELDAQIGLTSVKEQVAKLQSAATVARIRADRGLSTSARSLHLAFTGPPGTGKTTVARVIAKMYCGLGFIKSDKVIEATRRDMVGEHLGSTAIKTSALIDSAMDGVLFIDEAYTLVQQGLSGGDAFGREAVDTLLARMEDNRDRLVVIIAGYDAEIDRFLASNDGLASRFARRIRFESYTPRELASIGDYLARRRDSILTPEAAAEIEQACAPLYEDVREAGAGTRRGIDLAGNGRFVRNIVESAEEEREYRLTAGDLGSLSAEDLMRIEASDVRAAIATLMSGLALNS